MFRRSSGHITIILAAMLAGLAGGGCSSTRIILTPPVKQVTVPATNRTVYHVEKVTLNLVSKQHAPPPDEWNGDGFASQFIDMAAARYPDLFNTSDTAIPLTVQIDLVTDLHQALGTAVFFGTLGIVGGIFPGVPYAVEWQVKIRAADAGGAPILTTQFQADGHARCSVFSPLGLISIPGESDAPKVSAVMVKAGMFPQEHRTYVTQCMVDRLAAELLKLNPAKLRARAAVSTPRMEEALPQPDAAVLPNF